MPTVPTPLVATSEVPALLVTLSFVDFPIPRCANTKVCAGGWGNAHRDDGRTHSGAAELIVADASQHRPAVLRGRACVALVRDGGPRGVAE